MGALVVHNYGEVIALEAMVGKTPAPATMLLRLFYNDTVPADASSGASYAPVVGGGYADITLTGTSWNAGISGDPSYITYAEQTFTFTGDPSTGQDVYGYVILDMTNDPVNGEVMWAERFIAAPYTVFAGKEIKITPRIEAS